MTEKKNIIFENATSPTEKIKNNDKDVIRENLILSILLNNNEEDSKKIKEVIELNDFKDEKNKKIAKKLYEQKEIGNINNKEKK